jgi:hypothetical protein
MNQNYLRSRRTANRYLSTIENMDAKNRSMNGKNRSDFATYIREREY